MSQTLSSQLPNLLQNERSTRLLRRREWLRSLQSINDRELDQTVVNDFRAVGLVPLCGNDELESSYCQALRQHKSFATFLKDRKGDGHKKTARGAVHRVDGSQAVVKNRKLLSIRHKLDTQDFQNTIRDLYLSIDIQSLPPWSFISNLSDGIQLKRKYDEDLQLRRSVKNVTAKEIFSRYLEFLTKLSPTPLIEDDLYVFASHWYFAVLDDDFRNEETLQNMEITDRYSDVLFPSVHSLLARLSVSDTTHNGSIQNCNTQIHNTTGAIRDTVARGVELVHELTFFDRSLLIARTEDELRDGRGVSTKEEQTDDNSGDQEIENLDFYDIRLTTSYIDRLNLGRTARWLGTLEDVSTSMKDSKPREGLKEGLYTFVQLIKIFTISYYSLFLCVQFSHHHHLCSNSRTSSD